MSTPSTPAPWSAPSWEEIHRRIELARRALETDAVATPDRARIILEERARRLARPAASTELVEGGEMVGFALGRERYALDARYVLEAFRLAQFARLPRAAPPLFGLTAWRGALLTLLDIRPVLGLPAAALNDLGHVLVVGAARAAFGVVVDSLEGVQTLPASAIGPPGVEGGTGRRLLRGVTDTALLVLDPQALLGLLNKEIDS